MCAGCAAVVLDSGYIFIRVLVVTFVSIYAIVVCRKRRSKELISTATMSADALSPTPSIKAEISTAATTMPSRHATRNEKDSLNFIRAAQKLLANEEIVSSQPSEVKAEKTITVTYRATEEDDESEKPTKTSVRTLRSKQLTRRRTPAGAVGRSMEECTQKSEAKLANPEKAEVNKDATAIDCTQMATLTNNVSKSNKHKTKGKGNEKEALPLAAKSIQPESEDCQKAMLMRWFGAAACSLTSSTRVKKKSCQNDDETQESRVNFNTSQRLSNATRTPIVANNSSKFAKSIY